jgi:hypothetical protein
LLALYACLGAIGIWLTLRGWFQARVGGRVLRAAEHTAVGILVAVVGVSAFFAVKNVTTLIVEPQMTELRVLRSHVAQLHQGAPRIAFVRTGSYGGFTNRVVYDEIGLPSTEQPWALEPAVALILREEGRLPPNGVQPVVDVYPSDTATFPKGEPVLDLRGLRQLR